MKKTELVISVPEVRIGRLEVTLIGDSPLICHAWDEKTKKGMLDTFRAFVSVIEDNEPIYTDIVRAMKDPGLREQVLAQAKTEFEELRDKYRDLKEFARVYAELDLVKVIG